MKITKEQITTGWSLRRVLSIFLGGFIIYKAIITQEALSGLFGVVLIAIGLLNIGCASGCCGGSYSNTPVHNPNNSIQDVVYEEIK